MKKVFKPYLKLTFLSIFYVFCLNQVNAANFTSAQNGDWDVGATWGNASNVAGLGYPGPTDNATITAGKTVQVKIDESVNDITINSKGVLIVKNNKNLTILGNYILNGTHTGGNGAISTFSGTSKTISGLGTLDIPGGVSITSSRSILIGSNLLISSDVYLLNTVTITNNGAVTMVSPGNVTAGAVGPTWINAANSSLKTGAAPTVLSNVTLDASATGNTVNYYQIASQNIKLPTNNTYYNLSLTGTGIKTLVGDITVLGNLKIEASTLAMSTFTLNLRGNWSNEGTLTGTGTVLFTGTNNQSISNSSGEVFYNMTTNKSSGYITLTDDVAVSNVLTMTNGQINANLKVLSIGTSISTLGVLTRTGGFVFNGFVKRWVNATNVALIYPMGIQYGSYYAPLTITFINLSTSGALMVRFPPLPGTTNNGLPLVDNGTTVYNTFGTGFYTLTPLNGLTSNNYNAEAVGLPFYNYYTSTRILARSNGASNWVANGTHKPGVAGTGPAKRDNLTMLPADLVLADTVNCSSPITAAFTGSRTVCTNSVQTYSVPNTGNTFLWIVQGGTQTSGGNTNTITVNWGTTGMTGVLIVIEINACGSGIPAYDFITIGPTTISSITGKDYAPENTSVGGEETYSIPAQPGYTYSWAISRGTIITGAGTESVTVRWGAAGAGQISVGISNSCGTATTVKPVTVYIVVNSIKSGDWDNPTTWDCTCIPAYYNSVRVRNPHTVSLPNSDISIVNLVADIGGTFSNTTTKTLTVTGDILIDGTYTGTTNLIMDGLGSIDGIGTISTTGNFVLIGGNKSILSSASLAVTGGDVSIATGNDVTNNGIITISKNILGAASSSTWINQANSALEIGGAFLATGTTIVNTVPNTVEYIGSTPQNIRLTDYYNLSSISSGARILPSTGIVGVAGHFSPGVNAYTITGSTVNFYGTNQTIEGFTFNNLTISGGGVKTLTGSITHNSVLTFTNGIITTGSFTVTAPSTATVSRTSGYVNGNYKKWISNTSTKTFEIGTATNYTPLDVTYAGVTTAGYVTANATTGDHPSISSTCLDPNKSVNVFYTLANNTLTAGTFSLGFNYLASNIDVGATPANFNVEVYSAGAWSIPLTLSGTPTSTLTTVTGVSTYGSYEIAEGIINSSCTETWTGATSTAWNTASNWSAGYVPISGTLVTIPSGTPFAPTVSATSTAANVTINSGATLTLSSTAILNATGNIINNGILTSVASSTVGFTGNSAQTITGVVTLYNVKINNTNGGVSILSALTVNGTLTLTSGVLTTGSNLKLNFDNGGNIAYNSSDAGSISGNVTGSRAGLIRSHYIAAPFSGVTSAQVQATTPLFYNTYWKMYSRDFTTQGWAAVINTTTAMPLGSAFSLSYPSTSTLVLTGTYSHSYSFTSSSYSNATAGKYILIGNPYPTTIDWTAASGWTKTNVGNAIYFWNASNNTSSSYVNGTGAGNPVGTPYIGAMQSFLVATVGTVGTASVSIANPVRLSTVNAPYLRVSSDETIRIKIQSENIEQWDDAVVRFNESATNDFDPDFDAYKIINNGFMPSVYTSSGNTKYAIHSVADADSLKTIPVSIKLPADGNYTLSVSKSDPAMDYILVDKKLGTENLLSDPTYTFSGLTTDDVNRFELKLRTAVTTGMQGSNASAGLQISSATKGFVIQSKQFSGSIASVEIMDVSGKLIYVISDKRLSEVSYIPLDMPDGAYMIKVTIDTTVFAQMITLTK